jgi:hypothetical protein
MVYNSVRHVMLPHHKSSNLNALSSYHKNMSFIKGSGNGSVLLRKGGAGAASSYMDMDDYISTTGINPYARASPVMGKGIPSKLSAKLSKLSIAPPSKTQRKNIVMNM